MTSRTSLEKGGPECAARSLGEMTPEDWREVIRWLNSLGLRVLAIDREKDQVTVQLPGHVSCEDSGGDQ